MVSDRAMITTPFEAMDVFERANELDDVIHLEVGEPDFEPPEPVLDAAIRGIQSGQTGYTEARGKPALREAIARYYDSQYGVDVSIDQIIVTPGSSPALMLAYLAVLNPGDKAVVTDPYYACYPNFIRQAGGSITTVPLAPADGFAPDLAAFDQTIDKETGTLMVNSPANPTGAVLEPSALEELTTITQQANATIISDEAYHGLDYDDRAASVLEFTDNAFVVDSFSKRFGMTGWRLGWLVTPNEYTDVCNRLAQNLLICASNFVQEAGIAALNTVDDFIGDKRATYRDRRDYLVRATDDLGLSLDYVPGGAYYLLVDVREYGDAFDVANLLLEEAGVATTPGRDFGPGAAPFLRLSYATSLTALREAITRIDRTLNRTTVSEQG